MCVNHNSLKSIRIPIATNVINDHTEVMIAVPDLTVC